MKNFKIQAKKRFIEAPTILSFNECDLLKWVTWCFVQGPKMDLNLLGEKAKSVRMQRKVLNVAVAVASAWTGRSAGGCQ